ncbi:MAG: site-specific integrase [bacterium]|nr:site-specific integrase [bacterium]
MYTEEEFKKILDTCRKFGIRWFADFFSFLLTTGFRRGEALGIRVKDIIVSDEGKVLIKITREKSHLFQEYPVPFELTRQIILSRCAGKNPEDFVFTDDDGNPLTGEKLRCTWDKIKKATGIKGVLHGTRHTFATWMRLAGVDPDLIRFLLGQKTLDMTYHYIHFRNEDFLKLTEKSGTLLAHFDKLVDENVGK